MSSALSAPYSLRAAVYPSNPAPPGRMVQLDGIRGLAVLGVLAWHWAQWPHFRFVPLGIIAVRVFFVLSDIRGVPRHAVSVRRVAVRVRVRAAPCAARNARDGRGGQFFRRDLGEK